MAFDWNIFRIVADLYVSKSTALMAAPTLFQNAYSSGRYIPTGAQKLWYLIVFCARYLPYPLLIEYDGANGFHKFWNFTLKIFYILSSAYILILMMRVYARTRERETAWKVGAGTMAASLTLAPFVMLIFEKKIFWSFGQYLWTFSIILESVCVLPQLLLLRQTTVPTVIDSFYLVTLGSYRGFYVINWIVRGAKHQGVEPVSVIFGSIQTALYIDFAWVYFTRQRVKLRGGSLVDGDDLSKGWLVKRLIGARAGDETVFEQAGEDNIAPSSDNRWGPRGISVSADDGIHDVERGVSSGGGTLDDPRHFEDDLDEDDDGGSIIRPRNGH